MDHPEWLGDYLPDNGPIDHYLLKNPAISRGSRAVRQSKRRSVNLVDSMSNAAFNLQDCAHELLPCFENPLVMLESDI